MEAVMGREYSRVISTGWVSQAREDRRGDTVRGGNQCHCTGIRPALAHETKSTEKPKN